MEEKVQKLVDSDNIEEVVKEFLARALTEFNKWHGPEAVAKLVKLDGTSIVAELSGPFCRTCGLYDYFDDLKLELEKVLGRPLVISQVESGGDESYEITYSVAGEWDEG